MSLASRVLIIEFVLKIQVQDQIFACLLIQFGYRQTKLFRGAALTPFGRSEVKS
jgi:hypothetical protein